MSLITLQASVMAFTVGQAPWVRALKALGLTSPVPLLPRAPESAAALRTARQQYERLLPRVQMPVRGVSFGNHQVH